MKKRIVISVIGVVLLLGSSVGAIYLYQSNSAQAQQKLAKVETPKTVVKEISYKGKDGVTALDLLKQNATAESTSTGYVTSINGVKPGKNEYWSLNINGSPAMVGAGSYVSKNTDTITWKIDTF